MKQPIANQFFQTWNELASSNAWRTHLLENWHKRKKFTSLVKDEEGCLLENVAKALNLNCYSEYYHTDAILYKEGHLVPKRDEGSTWFRGIEIAFEHEHSYDNRLYQEISHLLILHAKLYVTVTYPPERNAKDFRDLEHLDDLHSLIKDSPKASELDANENFLLIFGYEEKYKWRALVYKNDWWKEISVPAQQSPLVEFINHANCVPE